MSNRLCVNSNVMSNDKYQKWSGRLFAEFLVVFLSITLAFVAEDWRQARNDRQEESEALVMMLRDLQDDQKDLALFKTQLEEDETGGARVFELLSTNANPDSLLRAVRTALSSWGYRFSFPTYEGLVQTGKLDLIKDADLRDAIITYHDETLGYLEILVSHYKERNRVAENNFHKHIWRQRSADGWRNAEFVSSVSALKADTQALGSLSRYSTNCWFLGLRIESLFLPRSIELEEKIKSYLEN